MYYYLQPHRDGQFHGKAEMEMSEFSSVTGFARCPRPRHQRVGIGSGWLVPKIPSLLAEKWVEN